MKQQVGVHPRNHIQRLPDPGHHRAGFHHLFDNGRICFFNINHGCSSASRVSLYAI